MLNTILLFGAVFSCVAFASYLAYWGWKDMKEHESKARKQQLGNQ